jgi:hypothetical protein
MKSLAISLLIAGALALHADVTVRNVSTMAAHATVNVEETGCQNHPGPWVTLDGEIALGGMQVKVILQNNVKGTHTATVTNEVTAVLLNLGESITIPKQPVLGGVGGNPHISIQFLNGAGEPLGDEIYLGRCVQGLTIPLDLLLGAITELNIGVSGCSNNPGPWITLGGSVTLSGVSANIIFRNNVKGTHTAEETTTVTLLKDGTELKIPKQPVRGGAGGNPIISIQLLDGQGNPVGDVITLGKCNKI